MADSRLVQGRYRLLDLIGRGGTGRERCGGRPDALTAYRRVASARERVPGSAHPDTLAGRNGEAHCLEQLGRGAEAVEPYRRAAVARRQRASGGRLQNRPHHAPHRGAGNRAPSHIRPARTYDVRPRASKAAPRRSAPARLLPA